jgi:hypothetical protein
MIPAAVVMTAVMVGGQDWFNDLQWRFFVEIGGTIATLSALVFTAFVVDKRGWATLGFSPRRLFDLLTGTALVERAPSRGFPMSPLAALSRPTPIRRREVQSSSLFLNQPRHVTECSTP